MAKKSTAVALAPTNPREVAVNLRVTSQLPAALDVDLALIASEVARYEDQAEKAVVLAERLDPTDKEQLDKILDLTRAITGALAQIERDRKAKTSGLDALKKKIMKVYEPATLSFQKAQQLFQVSIRKWRQAEAERLTKEAEEKRLERQEIGARYATEQAATGDLSGAVQILEEAAAMEDPEVKVSAVSESGSLLSTRKRFVGEVTDTIVFLRAVLAHPVRYANVLATISFQKTSVNALAKAVGEAEESFPGLAISQVENDVVM